jgi:amino acid transporter
LAVAFFIASLFVAIAVQIVLRRDDPEERPVGIKAIIVTVHLFISLGGIVGGFMVVCIAMMKFGRTTVGAIGLGLLGLIPLWVIVLFWVEWKHGLLYETSPVQDESGDLPQISQNKFE